MQNAIYLHDTEWAISYVKWQDIYWINDSKAECKFNLIIFKLAKWDNTQLMYKWVNVQHEMTKNIQGVYQEKHMQSSVSKKYSHYVWQPENINFLIVTCRENKIRCLLPILFIYVLWESYHRNYSSGYNFTNLAPHSW